MRPGEATAHCARHPEAVAAGTCARCGAFACPACERPGIDGRRYCVACEPFMPRALAWDGQGPLLRRWFSTAWALSTRPKATLAGTPADGSAGGALAFALLAGAVGWCTSFLAYAVLTGLPMLVRPPPLGDNPVLGGLGGGWPAVLAAVTVGVTLLQGLMAVAGTMVSAVLLSLVEHAIVGGFSRGTPWSVSLRAHALSYAPALAGLLPCCGWPVMLAAAIPLRVLALERFHGCSLGRATVAVLVPVAAVCAAFGALMGLAVMAGWAMARHS